MNQHEEDTMHFSPFWPLCLMALSLAIFLGWQVSNAVRQYLSLMRLGDQQTLLTGQAQQTETKLQAMMMDLLELSKTDAEARTIVNKYKIKFNPYQSSVLPTEAVLPDINLKGGTGTAAKPPAEGPGGMQ
jgi:hypothetical protein